MKRAGILLLALALGCHREQKQQPKVATAVGDVTRGRALIDQYGCPSCHVIPGIEGPKGMIGPALDHIGSRPTIASKFPNTPETMTKWLQDPQAMDPQNGMPNLNITAADSRDITAYLFSLK